jgi:hypothetical protein
MKRKSLITLLTMIGLLAFQNAIISAQESASGCKVLKKEIAGTYQGECKNGFAEGNGMAKGQDIYIGYFKKGLPDGKGVYKFSDGSTFTGFWKKGLMDGEGELRYLVNGNDSVITGTWKADKFTGKAEKAIANDYQITNQSYIEYYSIKRYEQDKNLVEISFERVMQKYIPRDLEFTYSTGFLTKEPLTLSVHDFIIPASFHIHFTIQTTGGDRECNFDFNIMTPGKYTVHLINN